MDDNFDLMKWRTDQLQAELCKCVEKCRTLNEKIDLWEPRLKAMSKVGKAKTVIDGIKKSLSEYKLRRDIAEVRIDLCRKILDERQHGVPESQLVASGGQA